MGRDTWDDMQEYVTSHDVATVALTLMKFKKVFDVAKSFCEAQKAFKMSLVNNYISDEWYSAICRLNEAENNLIELLDEMDGDKIG